MTRIRGCMDILGGIMTIQISRWQLPQRQENMWPRHQQVRRFGSLLRGSALIMRGVGRGLLPNPEGRTGQELEHVATRMNGWLSIFGGCAALWFVLRPPRQLPLEDPSAKRGLQFAGALSATGGLMQGIADGVMPYPPRWHTRMLRRLGSALAFVSAALLFAPLVMGIVRGNRQLRRQGRDHRPEH